MRKRTFDVTFVTGGCIAALWTLKKCVHINEGRSGLVGSRALIVGDTLELPQNPHFAQSMATK